MSKTDKKRVIIKRDIATALARRNGITHREAQRHVNTIVAYLREELLKPDVERITIVDFLSLKKHVLDGYTGLSGLTGEHFDVPLRMRLKATFGGKLQEEMDNSIDEFLE